MDMVAQHIVYNSLTKMILCQNTANVNK